MDHWTSPDAAFTVVTTSEGVSLVDCFYFGERVSLEAHFTVEMEKYNNLSWEKRADTLNALFKARFNQYKTH